jgi:alpha-L-rhamnosidase
MGLLSEDDWQGRWIGNQIIRQEFKTMWPWGYWIWHPEETGIDKQVFFRKSFNIPTGKTVKEALVKTTADNYFTFYLNGTKIVSGSSWTKVYELKIQSYLKEGKNLIAVQAANNLGEVCGLIFSLKIIYDDDTSVMINSDKTWKTVATKINDWNTAVVLEKKWKKVKVIGSYENSDWGQIDSEEIYYPPRSIMVRDEFNIGKEISKACAYVTGLGNYVMYLNGKRVGKDIFTPGWTDYPTRIQYQVYDVTSLLKKGNNAVGALLGNMWWSGGLGWKGSKTYSQGPLRFFLQLDVNYTDGTKEQIVTNQKWKFSESPIIENHIYHGEFYDAREEKKGWAEAGYKDDDWESITIQDKVKAKLVVQQGPTLQVTEEMYMYMIWGRIWLAG